jgi:hypothetical protein
MFESEEKTVWKLALGPCERKNKSVVFRISPSSSLISSSCNPVFRQQLSKYTKSCMRID